MLKVSFFVLLWCLSPFLPSPAAGAQPSTVLTAAKAELARSMQQFAKQPEPPYFLSYEITHSRTVSIDGSFGTLTRSDESVSRLLDIDLRVGSYDLDNTHPIRGDFPFFGFGRSQRVSLPIEDDAMALRSVIWYHTDRQFKRAVEDLAKARTNVQVKIEAEDQSPDFSKEEPVELVQPIAELKVDVTTWEKKIRRFTAPFADHDDIYDARASFTATVETRWLVNSEGSTIQTSNTLCRLIISAYSKAEDGMELPRHESFVAFTPAQLPDDGVVLAAMDRMIQDLLALRQAPIVDPYIGPAILSGRASGVFFHEVFGHRIEGHRQKSEDEGQTFKKKIGEKLLPETFSVYFDPTLQRHAETDLVGFYLCDNQAVKARRVPVIENGIFKSFLMSRAPIEGFSRSNGHGRKHAGYAAAARQSNLFVTTSQPLSPEGLKQELLQRIRSEGKPFGLIFEDIQGGFTITGRMIPNAFNVLPIMVYRIFPDGRQELVRGVDLIGTPLQAFSNIALADDQPSVFNGTCGAESGPVPVSAVSPSILVAEIEVQKKVKSQERPPILPAPRGTGSP